MKIINRKTLSLAAAAVLSMCMLPGCARSEQDNSGKISVVCTSFSEYDWTRNIVGDSGNIQLTYLLESGIDLHNYQPSTKDILTISDCDLFIYVGGESDKWVSDTLGEARNSDMKVISLMNVLGESVKEEEIKEGMQAEEDEHSDEPEYDEHVWLSVKNAELFCGSICETLSDIDPENADKYRTNLESYKAELSALDNQKMYKSYVICQLMKTSELGTFYECAYCTSRVRFLHTHLKISGRLPVFRNDFHILFAQEVAYTRIACFLLHKRTVPPDKRAVPPEI